MLRKLPIRDAVAYGALAFALVFVFVDQAYDTGFQKGHRGWCSANVMAIIEHATWQNGFVGHTLQTEEDGSYRYLYFDRYPVFFAATMHAVLNTVELSRGEQIYVARQAMNVLYALTVVMAVAFLLELGIAPGIAVAAAAVGAAGKLTVTYRDMIHFDQAALFGFMALIWAIARWYRTRNDRFVYAITALAVCSGRGYASFGVLAVWWTVEAVLAARTSKDALKAFAFGTATRACLLSIAIAAACLSYNVWREAEKNGISIVETGIVDSAKRRAAVKGLDDHKYLMLRWDNFFTTQARRFVDNAEPFVKPGHKRFSDRTNAFLSLAIAGVIAAFIATRRRELRPPLIVAALAGLVWIVGMRGLTAFHEFTIMIGYSAMVVFFAALIHKIPERAAVVPALLACALLVVCTESRNTKLEKEERRGELYTADFARIAKALEPGQSYEIEPNDRKLLVPGVPYAIGWFLPENFWSTDAELIVSIHKKREGSVNLTPKNKKLFLHRELKQAALAR